MSGFENVENVEALLEFYRYKSDDFEKEREEMMNKLATTEVKHADLHRLKWELRVREEEIAELQNALSEANVHLYREREEGLRLLNENDELKIKEIESRRQIEQLHSLTDPVTHEVTFFKDCRPMITSKKIQKSGEVPNRVTKNNEVKVQQRHFPANPEAKGKGPIMRTIYLPNEKTEILAKRVQSLESQLDGQKRMSDARIEALEIDRVERQSSHKRTVESLQKQIDALESKVDLSEKSMREATKDYLELKLHWDTTERKLMERMASLQDENERLKTRANSVLASVMVDNENKMKEVMNQARRKTSRYASLKAQFDELNIKSAKEIHELTTALNDMKTKYAAIQQRRKFDLEGFQTDVIDLRKQLRTLETVAYSNTCTTSNLGASSYSSLDKSGIYLKALQKNKASLLKHELSQLREQIGTLEEQLE